MLFKGTILVKIVKEVLWIVLKCNLYTDTGIKFLTYYIDTMCVFFTGR